MRCNRAFSLLISCLYSVIAFPSSLFFTPSWIRTLEQTFSNNISEYLFSSIRCFPISRLVVTKAKNLTSYHQSFCCSDIPRSKINAPTHSYFFKIFECHLLLISPREDLFIPLVYQILNLFVRNEHITFTDLIIMRKPSSFQNSNMYEVNH